MRVFLKSAAVLGLALVAGCSSSSSSAVSAPPAEKVTQTTTGAGKSAPAGSATMPKEPGR